MGHDHAHGHSHVAGNERRLLAALALTGTFLVVEVIGGIVTGSLALLSDAAHMFTDVTALAIAFAAMRIGRRPVDDRRTYGYQRFEILAAAFNALLLFVVAGYILYEAYLRFRNPPEVQSIGMMVIAAVGFVVNFISLKMLAGGRDESLNVKGAYLEVWSDLLGSAGVFIAAIGIQITGWRWLDPLVAVAIGFWVLPRTWTLLKESTNILLEGTPAGMDLEGLRREMKAIPGVKEVHDLHAWALTSGKHVLTAHVVIAPEIDAHDMLRRLTADLRARFDGIHTTLQLEIESCGDMHAPPAPEEHESHKH